jgi:hypothetical protein
MAAILHLYVTSKRDGGCRVATFDVPQPATMAGVEVWI